MKAVVAAFNKEKALVGAFSVIVQLHRLINLKSKFSCRRWCCLDGRSPGAGGQGGGRGGVRHPHRQQPQEDHSSQLPHHHYPHRSHRCQYQ